MDSFESIGTHMKSFNPQVAAAPSSDEMQAGGIQAMGEQPGAIQTPASELAVQRPVPGTIRPSTGTVQRDTLDREVNVSPFMEIGLESGELPSFTGEYSPTLEVRRCVADRGMLLKYMVSTERSYNVTLSFPAYGVDPIVFDEEAAARVNDARAAAGDGTELEVIGGPEAVEIIRDGNATPLLYEKIEVDGVLYFSCIMECLDRNYMHSIIREATEAIFTHGQYMYTLVGPRPLVKQESVGSDGGDNIAAKKPSPLIETLKLNTYEMNLLVNYMANIEGVSYTHGIFDGRQAILFKKQ